MLTFARKGAIIYKVYRERRWAELADTKEIISKIMEDLRQKNSRNFSEKVYTDQPILIPASKMKNFTPPKYREMKAIARSYHSLDMSTAEIFYKQARFMEAFEDNYEYYGDFVRYYPTYRDMNDEQLRGYFSWRTKIRHGQYDPAPLAFAFVYIYELLNGIGSTDPKDGFVKLQDFRENFGKIDNRIENYMKLWLNDFAVYYDLDPQLITDLARTDFDKNVLALENCADMDDDTLFSAITELSSYRIDRSKLYKNYSDITEKTICEVFRKVCEYYAKNRKRGYCEKLFGKRASISYYMFSSAVFFDRIKRKNYEYSVSGLQKYRCENGFWTCEKYYGSRKKSTELGTLVKAVDRALRVKLSVEPYLKPDKITKTFEQIIEKTIGERSSFSVKKTIEKELAPPREITIDVSKLGQIRAAADVTCEKLITEEEAFDKTELEDINIDDISAEQMNDDKSASDELPLDDNEYEFLKLIIYKDAKSVRDFAKSKMLMISVIADSINDKLFDMFDDTVLEFESDVPNVIEDYLEELKGLIKP